MRFGELCPSVFMKFNAYIFAYKRGMTKCKNSLKCWSHFIENGEISIRDYQMSIK